MRLESQSGVRSCRAYHHPLAVEVGGEEVVSNLKEGYWMGVFTFSEKTQPGYINATLKTLRK